MSLPVWVLVVPQGTITRTYVSEGAFFVCLLGTLFFVGATLALRPQGAGVSRSGLHPLLLATLIYLALVNPLWSVLSGNEPTTVARTSIPFMSLGAYYLFAVVLRDPGDRMRLLRSCAAAAVLLSLLVFFAFLFWNDSPGRATGIVGRRTLSLPALPVGGVVLVGFALFDAGTNRRRFWGGLAVVVTVAILLSVTRAMLAAYLVGVVTVVLLGVMTGALSLKRVVWTASAWLVLFVVLARSAAGQALASRWLGRLDPRSISEMGTVFGRMDEYRAFFLTFSETPLFGSGLGTVVTFSSQFDFLLRDRGITLPHSHVFFFLGTTGLVGAGLYYALIGGCAWRLVKRLRAATRDGSTRNAYILSLGALMTGFLFTLTSTTYSALSYNVTLAALLFISRGSWDPPVQVASGVGDVRLPPP